jgi:pilus assembly protein Flp/PilA
MTGLFASRRMTPLHRVLVTMRSLWQDSRGQDLIEYALMAGIIAVAAGAVIPGVSPGISSVFSKVASVMTAAAGS